MSTNLGFFWHSGTTEIVDILFYAIHNAGLSRQNWIEYLAKGVAEFGLKRVETAINNTWPNGSGDIYIQEMQAALQQKTQEATA